MLRQKHLDLGVSSSPPVALVSSCSRQHSHHCMPNLIPSDFLVPSLYAQPHILVPSLYAQPHILVPSLLMQYFTLGVDSFWIDDCWYFIFKLYLNIFLCLLLKLSMHACVCMCMCENTSSKNFKSVMFWSIHQVNSNLPDGVIHCKINLKTKWCAYLCCIFSY